MGQVIAKTKAKKIVIGMTGGMASLVCAYLLKKQGHECIGIGINLLPPAKPDEISLKDLSTECHISKLEFIKEQCAQLEIPFYAADVSDRYKAMVADPVIESHLWGTSFSPCVRCNYLKIDTLMQKAKKLGADNIATAHFAKKIFSTITNEYDVLVSNDLANDQSFLLSMLSQEHLEKLILPLAEMRQIEVEKIYKSIGFACNLERQKAKRCFHDDHKIGNFIDKNVAKSLLKTAKFLKHPDDTFVADCQGFHYYSLGQNKIQLPEDSTASVDQSLSIVSFSPNTKTIYLDDIENYKYDYCLLNEFVCGPHRDLSRPSNGYLSLENHQEKLPCSIRFKSNQNIVVKFEQSYEGLLSDGKYAVLYDRSGLGGKIIGSGVIRKAGIFEEMDRVFEKKAEEDEKKQVVKDRFTF